MNDRIKSNRQERSDGMILYRPAQNTPTYLLSKEQDAEVRKLVVWQVVLGVAAGFPILVASLSWLSGNLPAPALAACIGVSLGILTPIGLRLERKRKDFIQRAPVSEAEIELPWVRHQLAQLWSIIPARHRLALRAAPFLMLLSGAVVILKHLFGGFPNREPPLSLTLSTVFFVLSIPLCWLVVRPRSGRTPSEKG